MRHVTRFSDKDFQRMSRLSGTLCRLEDTNDQLHNQYLNSLQFCRLKTLYKDIAELNTRVFKKRDLNILHYYLVIKNKMVPPNQSTTLKKFNQYLSFII